MDFFSNNCIYIFIFHLCICIFIFVFAYLSFFSLYPVRDYVLKILSSKYIVVSTLLYALSMVFTTYVKFIYCYTVCVCFRKLH